MSAEDLLRAEEDERRRTYRDHPAAPHNRYSDDVGTKDDGEKPRMDLLPFAGLTEVAHVLTFGATKYGAYNWHGLSVSRLYGAALRHLFAWWRGEDNDVDTGRSHLAHAACCVLMALEQSLHRRQYDDRPAGSRQSRGTCTDCKRQDGPCWCGDSLGCTC